MHYSKPGTLYAETAKLHEVPRRAKPRKILGPTFHANFDASRSVCAERLIRLRRKLVLRRRKPKALVNVPW